MGAGLGHANYLSHAAREGGARLSNPMQVRNPRASHHEAQAAATASSSRVTGTEPESLLQWSARWGLTTPAMWRWQGALEKLLEHCSRIGC